MPRTYTPQTRISAMPTAPRCLQVGAASPLGEGAGGSEKGRLRPLPRGHGDGREETPRPSQIDFECWKDTDPQEGATQRETEAMSEVTEQPSSGAWKLSPSWG